MLSSSRLCRAMLHPALCLVIAGLLTGCQPPPTPTASSPQKGPPPAFPLDLPPSIVASLPEDQEPAIEEVIRIEKRTRLYRTPALLPALEIVRGREDAFRQAAALAGMDERLFQGLIVLECGGRDDAIDYMFRQGRGKRAHVGLGQLGWIEAQGAGLKVAPRYEQRLKEEIRRSIALVRILCFGTEIARSAGKTAPVAAASSGSRAALVAALVNCVRRQEAIEAEWRGVDERFDPEKNLHATARLLRGLKRAYGGDSTLAVAAYHAGGGNIGRALRLARRLRLVPRAHSPAGTGTYWALYADRSGPLHQFMSGWSDDSRNYLPKVIAAADIVEKYLRAPDQFRQEYVYWGPDDAGERLAAIPYSPMKARPARSVRWQPTARPHSAIAGVQSRRSDPASDRALA